jgi:hypothetical protein
MGNEVDEVRLQARQDIPGSRRSYAENGCRNSPDIKTPFCSKRRENLSY